MDSVGEVIKGKRTGSLNFLSRLVLRRAGLILLITSLLSVVGVYYSARLYMNLRTDIEELLPDTARSVVDLYEVTGRLASTDNLAVLTFSNDTQASKRFILDLAQKLRTIDPTLSAGIEYRIDHELEFFKKRRALYMELEDLYSIRDYIRNRIQYEKSLYNPLTLFRSTNIPEPTFDFQLLERKYNAKVSGFTKFPGGFYATPDEKIRTILIHKAGKASGIDGAHKLRHAVDVRIAELDPKKYAPDLEVKFTGGVQDLIEEHASLMADLELSTILSVLLVALAMIWFYRSVRGTFAIIVALLMGSFWCFGISYFVVGYLNANSAFLGAIVIGNGINYGIIFLARYLEERRKGVAHIRATHFSITRTWKATVVASLAAGFAYGSLALTDFRGFKQFGIIGLIGMGLCWISAFTVLPALLTFLEKLKPLATASSKQKPGRIATAAALLVVRFPKLLVVTMATLTALSIYFYQSYEGEIFETDLSKLRDKKSNEEGSGYLSHHLHEIFQGYPHPLVVLARNPQEAGEISKRLKSAQTQGGQKSLIASVRSLDDFLPQQQEEKIEALREIRRVLTPKIWSQLSEKEQVMAEELLNPEASTILTKEGLPALVKKKLAEKNGTLGNLVLVEPPLGKTEDVSNLIRFIGEVRGVADSVHQGTPVAGTLAVSADMIGAIRRDGPKATTFAFLAVVVLVILLFRQMRVVSFVVGSLLLGVIWLAGLIYWMDIKINFLNFIALPITFGIGVDYAVNVFQRYQIDGPRSIGKVVRHTGGAVGLASLTTVIGYGSLLIAGNQAFVSFGLLAVLGEITCLLTATLFVPALALLMDREGGRPQKPVNVFDRAESKLDLLYQKMREKRAAKTSATEHSHL